MPPTLMRPLFLPLLLALAVLPALAEDTLRVCTFNIRYDNPGDAPHDWPHRRDTLAAFLAARRVDVAGLQEVLHGQLEDLKERLPQYGYVGVGREDGREKGEYAPVLFLKSRFRLLRSGTFWLSQHPGSAGFIGWDGACTRLATWAVLEDRQGGEELFVLNTHFDHAGAEARRQSARLIRQKMDTLAGGRKRILTGDLNVSDRSEAYRILQATPSLCDAWKAAERREGVSYTFHDFGRLPRGERAKIDFVFVSPAFHVLESSIPAEYPAAGFLSDHNPQFVLLSY